MNSKFGFIYAVCGSKNFIDELNFSLPILQKNTRYPILVLTDLSRNEEKINHQNVLSVETPKNLNHHQASIFLKTSVAEISPFEKSLYLDADTVVLNHQIDSVFELNFELPLFADDLYNLNQYSRYALNNGILERVKKENEALENLMQTLQNFHSQYKKNQVSEKALELESDLLSIKKNPIKHFLDFGKILAAKASLLRSFSIKNKWIYKAKTKTWHNLQGATINVNYQHHYQNLVAQTPFRFDTKLKKWVNQNHEDVFDFNDWQLWELLNKEYNLRLTKTEQTISNGGVFGFTANHKTFFKLWQNLCLNHFEDQRFRTRDQTALIIAKHRHKSHLWPKLPNIYNTLIDENHRKLAFGENPFYVKVNQKIENPVLLHFINGFGNSNFALWQYVLKLVEK